MKNNNFSETFQGANGRFSSKRIIAFIVILVILAVAVIHSFRDVEPFWVSQVFFTLLAGAFALLGCGIFEKKLPEANKDEEEKDESDMCS